MTHPAEPHLQAYIDGELPTGEEAWLVRHVRGCAQCTATLDELRADSVSFRSAVQVIDGTEPVEWQQISRRAASRPGRSAPWTGPLRWAALVLFSVTAISAATLVGRSLLRDRATSATDPDPVQAVAEPDRVAGVFVAPVAGRVIVHVNGAAAGSRLRVARAERSDVSVQVTSATAVPRFRVDERAGVVTVDLAGQDGTVNIEVPSTLQSGEIRVRDRLVVRITDGAIDPPEAAVAPGLLIGS